jgi:YfiH family protein
VLENRGRVAGVLGIEAGRITWAEQVHGAGVAVVGEEDAGRGSRDHDDALPGVDALVTSALEVPIALLAADCVLVLLHDGVAGALGLAHAGWRGTAAGVIEETIEALARLGARPERTEAALSPAIGPCCYEVSGEVAAAVGEAYARRESGRTWLDLPGAVTARLRAAGVRRIAGSPGCTRCAPERWFSYRAAGGTTGRHGVLAWLGGRSD